MRYIGLPRLDLDASTVPPGVEPLAATGKIGALMAQLRQVSSRPQSRGRISALLSVQVSDAGAAASELSDDFNSNCHCELARCGATQIDEPKFKIHPPNQPAPCIRLLLHARMPKREQWEARQNRGRYKLSVSADELKRSEPRRARRWEEVHYTSTTTLREGGRQRVMIQATAGRAFPGDRESRRTYLKRVDRFEEPVLSSSSIAPVESFPQIRSADADPLSALLL